MWLTYPTSGYTLKAKGLPVSPSPGLHPLLIAPQLGRRHQAAVPLRAGMCSGLRLHGSCACCYSAVSSHGQLPYSIWEMLLLCGHSPPLALNSNPGALGGRHTVDVPLGAELTVVGYSLHSG